MKTTHILFVLVVSLSLLGCPPTQDAAEPRPAPIEDVDDVQAGCARLQELECHDILDELKGAAEDVDTCDKATRHLIESGTVVNVKCWQTVQSCEEVDTDCS